MTSVTDHDIIVEKAQAAATVLAVAAQTAADTLHRATETALDKIKQENTDKIERLTRIETIVTNLQTRLLGNGQPGELQKLDTRIAGVREGFEVRLKVLEDGRSRTLGGLYVISLVVLLLGGLETLRMLKVF